MPKRDPFDYFGCPEYMIVITRWDGRGSTPKELFRAYAVECPWAHAAKTFASQLLKSIPGSSQLSPAPKLRRAAHVDPHA